ncbi:DUF2149 domain-containing protein [Pelotomaculum isophthalicicum JI]|uniref:DUF2149 domain-containing protein n=1 Tax=Pelotomaculum isophthalicicum JI TaxID=947010 RepID=A0A9X4H2P1_9FIRM|nr:DUF2149 domain-containing protein [Pelotomaculum isophthalicicum]MDF9409015.1 DUF2149 domain-containing protein [Pelotomaculum isophthalicicum JI]
MDGGLRSRRRGTPEEVNPMDGAINIVDAMLVFACGLMLSLVMHWNVDLGRIGERVNLERGREVLQDPEIRDDLIETEEGRGRLYEKMGTVYKDPATGQLFMLTNQ